MKMSDFVHIYQYNWNYVSTGDFFYWTGVGPHTTELGYVYGRGLGGHSNDDIMSALIRNYLHRFLVHKNVNVNDSRIDSFYQPIYGDVPLPQWRSHTRDIDEGLQIQPDALGVPQLMMWRNLYHDQCDDLWDAVIPIPIVTPRMTQCMHDECSVNASHHANVCIDNYNGTYYCQCGSGWKPANNDTECVTGAHGGDNIHTEIGNTRQASFGWDSVSIITLSLVLFTFTVIAVMCRPTGSDTRSPTDPLIVKVHD